MRWLVVLLVSVGAVGCTCGKPGVDPGGAGGGDGGGDGGGAAGGGSGGGTSGGCVAGLTAIDLAPASQVTTISQSPSPIAFTANGTVNGAAQDVSSSVTWTATRDDDTPAGEFDSAGNYSPHPGAGGTVKIKATDGCVTGETTLTLKVDATFNDPGPTISARFVGNVVNADATKSPVIVYPSDQTRFPRNIYKILFQWQKKGNDYFRLVFDGPYSKTVVYSDGANVQCQAVAATAGCSEATVPQWLAIAGSNAGAATTLTIEGVRTGDTNVYRSAPIQISFSKRDVKGAIFYWSTTAAGIRRASVSDQDPEAYVVAKPVATLLPNNGGAVKCVACHTVSRSGKKLFAYTEATVKGEYVYNVTLQPPPAQIITTQISTAKGFGTFRPDDKRVVATVGNKLAEFDADTGAKIVDLPMAEGTNPDWSPATSELVYSDQGGDSPAGANLSVIGYDGGWGAVRVAVPAGGLSNLFPSYSPNASYIAYARGKGGHGDNTFQLWLVKAAGGEAPIELVTANRIVNSQVTAGQFENNMPTWAPPGDLDWIAFNSKRPYGVVYPNGGTQQIWVTAIDPALVGTKKSDGGMVDPSYPAFRFAFQGLAENNHRAFWTLDVRDPPDGGPSCAGLGSVCGTGVTCCSPLTCQTGGELGASCQTAAPDAGACLTEGTACSQTSGAACCGALVCDVGADGGTSCVVSTIN